MREDSLSSKLVTIQFFNSKEKTTSVAMFDFAELACPKFNSWYPH